MWSKTADLRQGPAITGPAERGVSLIPDGTESAVPVAMPINVTWDGRTEMDAKRTNAALRALVAKIRRRVLQRKMAKRRLA